MYLIELVKELESTEATLKVESGNVIVVTHAGSSSSKPKAKEGNKRKKNNKKGPKLQAKKAKVDEKPKGKCFHCKQKGTWKQ
jgi:hypothetical protein